MQQKSQKKLYVLIEKNGCLDFLDCFDVKEIEGNVNFQLEEFVIENQMIYLCGKKILEFLKNQTSLKKFVIRMYYDDTFAQDNLPQIYSKVLKMKNLRHVDLFSQSRIQLDDFTPHLNVRTFILRQDLG